jgi:hypothetical protein
MTMRPRYAAVLLAIVAAAACLDDPVGPGVLTVTLEGASTDTVWTGSPGEALPGGIRVRISDEAGHPVSAATLLWEAEGRASSVSGSAHSNSTGEAAATWSLGTDAAEEQRLRLTVRTSRHETEVVIRAQAVPWAVAALRVVADTPAVLRVGDTLQLQVQAIDPYGNVFPAPDVLTAVGDSTLGSSGGLTVAGGPRRGRTSVLIASHGATTTLPLHVIQVVAAIVPADNALLFSSLGAVLPVAYVVRDDRGRVIGDTAAVLSISDTNVVRLDGNAVRSMAPGDATLHLELAPAVATIPLGVDQRIVTLSFETDSMVFDALLDTMTLSVVGRDSLGAVVADTRARTSYVSTDPLVVGVSPSGVVQAGGNGAALVIAQSSDGPADTIRVVVAQRVATITVNSDSVLLQSLQAEYQLLGVALDRMGVPVASASVAYAPEDTTIAPVDQTGLVRAVGNGTTRVLVTAGSITLPVPIRVHQVATSLTAQVIFDRPIVTLPVGAVLAMQCNGYDGNGFAVPDEAALVATANGTVASGPCSDIRVARSGHDTLVFALGAAEARVTVVIAATAIPNAALGELISTDSLNAPAGPWAPSVGRGPDGALAVYYTAFAETPDSSGFTRGDLHRLQWLGGNQFRYDGVMLTHDDDICSPQGQGIENVAIVPRSDGAGWRMLYAAGSSLCYGWQVFSATSDDGRVWSKEPGVRLSNGGVDSTFPPPWPAGEGMVVEQVPGGEWRMIVSTFEHLSPPKVKWQITEWRSPDQLTWQYVGPVLTTRDMPTGWQGSVYSPTIRQVAPGLWRMLFTADGRGSPGSRSAIWSAVSMDSETWQVESEVIGGTGSNIYYAAFLEDRVVFVRRDGNGVLGLATALLSMP